MLREFQINRILQGSLDRGADLLEGLLGIMKQHEISAGIISGIGSVSEARLAYYNQETKKYEEKAFPKRLEIVSLKGNISIKDDKIFPHIHTGPFPQGLYRDRWSPSAENVCLCLRVRDHPVHRRPLCP